LDKSPENAASFLDYLDTGNFNTIKVQEIRFASLNHQRPDIAFMAAKGIGKSLPKEGLKQLVNALFRRDIALSEIVGAITAYGKESKIYLPQLELLVDELEKAKEQWPDIRINAIKSKLDEFKKNS